MVLLIFLIALTMCDSVNMESAKAKKAKCVFPTYLQTTESKPWILNHTKRIVTYYVGEGEITVYDCSKDTHKCSRYRRECWKRVLEDRYLVRHIESVYTDMFLCLRFLPRSKSIIQISTSHIKTGSTNQYLCHDQWLSLDPWPWISHLHYAHEHVECPFSGGYNFDMYFNGGLMNRNKKCSDIIPPVKIESDCTEGEGFTFTFRNKNCLHEEGNFDLIQKTTCVATWKENGDSFAVLRKNNDRYFWCIRVINSSNGDISKIIVFLDWICKHGNIDNNNIRYLRLDKIGKRKITHECADEFYGCESLRELCTTEIQNVCPRTCGRCSLNNTLKYCSFPPSMLGTWVKSTLEGNKQITIENSTLTIPEIGKFHCVTFDAKVLPLRRVLLQEFTNGCYPRFTCLQYNTPSSAVMRFRVSSVLLWPVYLSDVRICDDVNFQKLVISKRLDEKKIHTFPFESVIRKTNMNNFVSCNLPSSMRKVSSFIDDLGNKGCIVQGTFSTPHTILLSYLRDGDVVGSITYKCIGSLTYIYSLRSIIIYTDGADGEKQYVCWIILDKNQILEVPAASCNTFTATSIQNGDARNLLIRKFDIQEESWNCDNKTMAHLAQDWTVPPPISKQIASASSSVTTFHMICTYHVNIIFLMFLKI